MSKGEATLLDERKEKEDASMVTFPPKDKRVVNHPDSEQDVGWGPVNKPCDAQTFAFRENFKKYESGVSAEIKAVDPA
jgi:ATP-dependent phosphoenolpyruvate carboxykinase